MNIEYLELYLSFCKCERIEPTFEGLKKYANHPLNKIIGVIS